MKIGERIRNLRLSSNLTQEELADRADLTKGFISVLERDQTSISVDSLLQILRVLNVRVTDFFQEAAEKVVYDEHERTRLEEKGADRFELLIPGGANREMEAAFVRLLPGQRTDPVRPFRGETFGFILKGTLTLRFGAEKFAAHSGDSFYFSGEREHVLENAGQRPVEFIWVTRPPMF